MVYKNYYEHNIVKWSMIVLFLSLVLVYIVLYYAKSDLWQQEAFVDQQLELNQDLIVSEI
jgi:uncharacterized membrane protein